MGPKPESRPRAAAEVVFLLGGTLTVTQGQPSWGQVPGPVGSGTVGVGTTYTWSGAGAWKSLFGGQGDVVGRNAEPGEPS